MVEVASDSNETLVEQWKTLYAKTLPNLARNKDIAQSKWPVSLDHCFARIILDNTIGTGAGQDGENVQWDRVIKKPAVKNMTKAHLQSAIALGEQIQRGEVDLCELDEKSLQARGKNEKKYSGKNSGSSTDSRKRKQTDTTTIERQSPKKKAKQEDEKQQSTLSFSRHKDNDKQLPSPATSDQESTAMKDEDSASTKPITQLEKELNTKSRLSPEQYRATLKRIQDHKGLTPFRRRLYICLLSVPCGSYTTYAAMAKDLGSVARAVGNGMRNNPFAPDVPCHRVLASDGTIGGFCGEWGRDGKLMGKQNEKVQLLAQEGVKFDSSGKVKGPVFTKFWDLERFEQEYEKFT